MSEGALEELRRKSRETRPSKLMALVRIVLGLVIVGSGAMKFSVPMLWEVWSGQLSAANLPLQTLNLWLVPIVELTAGTLLVMGVYARANALVVIGMMVVAIYVHLVVAEPSLFPLQPREPVVPATVLAMAIVVLWRGAGAWSVDRLAAAEADGPAAGTS